MQRVFEKQTKVDRPARAVFAWLQRTALLERLCPPWETFVVEESDGSVLDGARTVVCLKSGPLRLRWMLVHEDHEEDVQFCDRQVSGPFVSWRHEHRVEHLSSSEAVLVDRIQYQLPWEPVSGLVAGWWVRRRLEKGFAYRHRVQVADLEMAALHGAVRPMKFVIAGASGLVGKALVPFLKSQGHQVVRLVRGEARSHDEVSWDPSAGRLDPQALKGADVIVNLSGENLAAGRWSEARKRAILESRVSATKTLVKAISEMKHRPFAMISASGVGFYGDAGEERLVEGSKKGRGFLADVCAQWEEASLAAEELGVRSVALRFGAILTPRGGMLAQLVRATRWGGGAILGNGRQWVSWISLDDALGVIYHSVLDQRCHGAVNAVAPAPVKQAEFTRLLARLLWRPVLMRVPKFFVSALFGEMGRELVLASSRALPGVLKQSGYVFRHETLEAALRHLLGLQGAGGDRNRSRGRRPRQKAR